VTRRRPHPRAATLAAIALPVLAPGALALATGDGDATATTPRTSPPVLVAEQVGTARHIVPFGIAGDAGDRRTIWAFGRTRQASTLAGTTPVAPAATTPEAAVLLQGTVATDGTPTAWARTRPPLDVAGTPLEPGTWRPADGTDAPTAGPAPAAAQVMHAGAGTAKGAAALIVRIAAPSGARTAILARTADGRFRELPAPPAELTAPAASAFAGPSDGLAPFAVSDATTDPADAQPDRGRTAILLAPAGGDGVLRWDGTRWSEEPWVEADGNAAGARTPHSLAATPAGDAVALFAGDATAASAARIRLARRDAKAERFSPVTINGSALLEGALPTNVRAISPAAAPGTALTIAPKHWWIDLLVTRSDDTRVSATVHLRPPGISEPGTTPSTTPAETTPQTSTTTPPTTTAPSSPEATDPSNPSTPTTPEPATPTDATANGSWCTPSIPDSNACDHELGFRFATTRGWSSAAFDGAGRYGERAISSPVIPEDTSATTPREASATGGFLQLTGTAFALRSGIGDDGTNDTQAARFAPGGFAVTGGIKAVGRTITRGAERDDAVRQNGPGIPDGALDIAISPPGTPESERGAFSLSVGMGVMRQQGTQDWSSLDFGLPSQPTTDPDRVERRAAPSALAWATPSLLIFAGPAGQLFELEPPAVERPYQQVTRVPDARFIDVGDDDLLDVAALGDEAFAVGRSGAAWRRTSGDWKRVTVPGTLSSTPLTSVAYAGSQPLVASPKGVLQLNPASNALEVDPELAALMREDGRPVSAAAVAGLPDGSAVVDGRYVRTGEGRPWQRLASPIEGDVIALALWRETGGSDTPVSTTPGTAPTTTGTDPDPPAESSPFPTSVATPQELGGLRIAASVADVRRGTQGLVREVRTGPGAKDYFTYEEPPLVYEGRLTVLGPNGWVDRTRTPVARSNGRDLAERTPPIVGIATDSSGNGWVAGGTGTLYGVEENIPTELPELFLAPLGQTLLDQRPADERPISSRARQLSERPEATTPSTPPTSTARPERARILVGGHPACLSECAGRGDQGLGPDATLEDALVTAEKVAATGTGAGPSVVVIGGGRAANTGSASDGLSRAGAQRYLELLREHPTVPTVLAIGTGDAVNAASRATFADAARDLLHERLRGGGALTMPTTPLPPIERPGSTTVAYALDVTMADGSIARLVVIDNAGGKLVGGANGPQAEWITQTLDDADARNIRTIVVGAARLDGAGGKQAEDREEELTILGRDRANAYIATDGPDDTSDPYFGDQTVRYPADVAHGGRVALYRTAALGHQRQAGLFAGFNEDDSDVPDAATGWTAPSILDVSIAGSEAPDISLLPVLTSIVAQELNFLAGNAESFYTLGLTRSTTGMRIPKPPEDRTPLVPQRPADEIPSETTPGDDPEDLPAPDVEPASTTPELVDTRAPGWTFAAAPACRMFGDDDGCRGQVPIDVTYEVADPSIAVFVRARPQRGNKPPIIVTDEHGDPVIDPTSSVLCPLRTGRTMAVIRVSGRTATYPVRVWGGDQRVPSPASAAKQAPCAFRWTVNRPDDDKDPKPAPTPVPAPPAIAEPAPQPQPAPRPDPMPRVLAPRPLAPLVAAVPFTPLGAPSSAAPPVAPNPKPAAPGAPPAPPSGVSTQQAPVHQSSVQVQSAAVQQTVGITAEERRSELAREGADYGASALSHRSPRTAAQESAGAGRAAERGAPEAAADRAARAPGAVPEGPTYPQAPSTPFAPLIGGGILAALTALAGAAAGRRRRRALARRRSWLR
jgi:hypothetical protein